MMVKLSVLGILGFGLCIAPAMAETPLTRPSPPPTTGSLSVPKSILTPQGLQLPELDDEDDDEPEFKLPLKDGASAKGKLGSGWTFQSLPSDPFGNVTDPKGRKLEMPGLRSEHHMMIGGRKSQTNGLSFGLDFDLPR